MATYPPPNFIEPITVFNTSNWISSGETIDEAFLNANYLKYPVAQGTETLQAINVNGISTFNNNIDAIGSLNRFGDYDNISGGTFLTINDTTQTITGNATASLGIKSIGVMSFGDLLGQGNGTVISTDDPNLAININAGGLTRIGEVNTNNSKIVIDPANQAMTLTAASQLTLSTFGDINLTSTGLVKIGDYAGSTTYMFMDVVNQNIDLYSATGVVALTSPNAISLNALPNGEITLFTAGDIRIGNIGGAGNQNELKINATKMTAKTTNGFQLIDSTIQYPSSYRTTSTTLATTFQYAQTFNGASITATLPLVDGNNVGTQYLITNTNATALTVASSGSQTIYSTISPATATSRSLGTGHSQIFTAIRTTATNVYGWSMV